MTEAEPAVAAENTPTNQPGQRGAPWKPGQSGNPAGKPKGSRNKLGEAFIQALYTDFKEHGADVIEKVREEKPDAYLKVVASILPQKLEIERTDGLTDDERRSRIREIAEQLGAVVNLGLVAGVGTASGGREEGARPNEAQPLQTIQ